MGSGFILTYLLLAAIAAPVVWFAWWAIASLGDKRPAHAARVVAAGAAPAINAFPHAVDTTFRGRPGEIVVRRLSDGKELSSCLGPDSSGRCPHLHADGTVPCAGAVLTLPRPVRGSIEWHIPAGYSNCMLGSYSTFRPHTSPS